jgi:short subunit fatty acids transporter
MLRDHGDTAVLIAQRPGAVRWGVVLVVAAALTRVLAVQVGLCDTCCAIMAEFQALRPA